MLTHIVFFVLGLGALVLGAELLVRGASKIALSLGISLVAMVIREKQSASDG